jgi:oligopeptide/dipeptide ABC transporter ATP-binding protein
MALLLITHDLGLVAQYAERVVVMYAGRVVEEAATADLFSRPLHPYARGLLASMPGRGGARRGELLRAIGGSVPHPLRLPSGCAFRDRCDIAVEGCADAVPELRPMGAGRRVRCIRAEEYA